MTDAWLLELFPRRKDLARLASGILATLDRDGYLPGWGWRRQVQRDGFSRSSLSWALSTLIRHGYVESRDAQIGRKRQLVSVYVRSEQFLGSLQERNMELTSYRGLHPWWLPAGIVKISRTRRKGPQNGGKRTLKALDSQSGLNQGKTAALKPSEFDESNRSGIAVENGGKDVFSLLAVQNKVSVEAVVKMLENDIEKEKLDVSTGELARMYLAEGS